MIVFLHVSFLRPSLTWLTAFIRSRGIDTLVSRGRSEVFFLDQLGLEPPQVHAVKSRDNDSTDSDEEQLDEGRKAIAPRQQQKIVSSRKAPADTITQKRYGLSFFKPGDPLSNNVGQEDLSERIPDLEYVRSFLETSAVTRNDC